MYPNSFFIFKKKKIFSLYSFFKKGNLFVINKSSHVHNKAKTHYRLDGQFKIFVYIFDFHHFKNIVIKLVQAEVNFYWVVKVKNN